MPLKLFIVVVCLLIAAGLMACQTDSGGEREIVAPNAAQTTRESLDETASRNSNAVATNAKTANVNQNSQQTKAKQDCFAAKFPDLKLNRKQTFAFDYEPFRNACFATFYEPDYDEYPLGERYFIYRDSKQIFEFPNQSAAANNHIEAVKFEDLNDDGLTDVIVVTSVGVKSGVLYSGFVYANNGESFTTDEQANFKLDDLKTTKEVSDFVRKNKRLFFK